MTHALVVDDNFIIVMHAMDILEEGGFTTFTAHSAQDALAILEQHGDTITLLFTDVEMPGEMDGFALARQVAARWPAIGILVASAHTGPQAGDMPEGAIFVGKPFSAEIVHARLTEILPIERRPNPLRDMR